jgi:peptidoglycan/LPS O-acetylase OafA/YrhL
VRQQPTSAEQAPAARFHGLDALRAAMMLLGVVLHVACSFQLGEADAGWGYRDPSTSLGATLLVLGIHAFRMPVFFVLAGFFAALVAQKRGLAGAWRERLRRVATPLVVGVVLLVPLVEAAFSYAGARALGGGRTTLMLHATWPSGGLAHLWFLWYLLLVGSAALGLAALARRLPVAWRDGAARTTRRWIGGEHPHRRFALLVGATWAILCTMDHAAIETPSGWWPNGSVLALYALCFGAGWLLHGAPEAWTELRSRWKRRLAGVAVALPLYLLLALVSFDGLRRGEDRTWAFAGAQACIAVVVWQATLGGMGAAEQLLRLEHPVVRWLVDASYWIYLVHLPLAVHVVADLRGWDAMVAAKLPVAVAIVLAACCASYAAAKAVLGSGSTR